MIRYALVCDDGHDFESWFRDSAAYDEQQASGFVACPHCGSAEVRKAIMAPRVARTDRFDAVGTPAEASGAMADIAPPAAPAPVQPDAAPAVVSETDRAVRDLMRKVHAFVKEHAEDVGPAFAEEARRMHEGEADTRPIWGQATPEEAMELAEDGIQAIPIPVLPDDRN